MTEKIIRVIDIEFSGTELSKLVEVELTDGSKTVTVQEWRPVYSFLMRGRPGNSGVAVDWSKVDWNQSNYHIGKQTGVSPATVAVRRSACGASVFKRQTVSSRSVTDEMINEADWELSTDSALAKQWQVSRERVRQIRLKYGKPRCKIAHTPRESVEALTWLLDHKEELNGKHLHDISRAIPFPILQMHTRLALVRRSGIEYVNPKKWKWRDDYPINWNLPNRILEILWNCSSTWVASQRSKQHAGKAKWHIGGFAKLKNFDEIKKEIELESENIMKFQIDGAGSLADVMAYIESRNQYRRTNQNCGPRLKSDPAEELIAEC